MVIRPGFGKQSVVFPVADLDGREQHPYLLTHALPTHLSLQDFPAGRALVSMAMTVPGIAAGHVFRGRKILIFQRVWPARIIGSLGIPGGDRPRCQGNDNFGIGMNKRTTHHPVPVVTEQQEWQWFFWYYTCLRFHFPLKPNCLQIIPLTRPHPI